MRNTPPDGSISVCPGKAGLARKAADEVARGFKCGTDEVKIAGERGRAIELTRH